MLEFSVSFFHLAFEHDAPFSVNCAFVSDTQSWVVAGLIDSLLNSLINCVTKSQVSGTDENELYTNRLFPDENFIIPPFMWYPPPTPWPWWYRPYQQQWYLGEFWHQQTKQVWWKQDSLEDTIGDPTQTLLPRLQMLQFHLCKSTTLREPTGICFVRKPSSASMMKFNLSGKTKPSLMGELRTFAVVAQLVVVGVRACTRVVQSTVLFVTLLGLCTGWNTSSILVLCCASRELSPTVLVDLNCCLSLQHKANWFRSAVCQHFLRRMLKKWCLGIHKFQIQFLLCSRTLRYSISLSVFNRRTWPLPWTKKYRWFDLPILRTTPQQSLQVMQDALDLAGVSSVQGQSVQVVGTPDANAVSIKDAFRVGFNCFIQVFCWNQKFVSAQYLSSVFFIVVVCSQVPDQDPLAERLEVAFRLNRPRGYQLVSSSNFHLLP